MDEILSEAAKTDGSPGQVASATP